MQTIFCNHVAKPLGNALHSNTAETVGCCVPLLTAGCVHFTNWVVGLQNSITYFGSLLFFSWKYSHRGLHFDLFMFLFFFFLLVSAGSLTHYINRNQPSGRTEVSIQWKLFNLQEVSSQQLIDNKWIVNTPRNACLAHTLHLTQDLINHPNAKQLILYQPFTGKCTGTFVPWQDSTVWHVFCMLAQVAESCSPMRGV